MDDHLCAVLQHLDTLLEGRVKQAFPNHKYRPLARNNKIYFSLPAYSSSPNNCYLDYENINLKEKGRQHGVELLRQRWNDAVVDGYITFEFPCFFLRQGYVGANPRLLKIAYHVTPEIPKANTI